MTIKQLVKLHIENTEQIYFYIKSLKDIGMNNNEIAEIIREQIRCSILEDTPYRYLLTDIIEYATHELEEIIEEL